MLDGLRGYACEDGSHPRIEWVICGGESGPKARPMYASWAAILRDQCASAGVAYFLKQLGEFVTLTEGSACITNEGESASVDGRNYQRSHIRRWLNGDWSVRVGKKRAGRLLDGRTHDEVPEVLR